MKVPILIRSFLPYLVVSKYSASYPRRISRESFANKKKNMENNYSDIINQDNKTMNEIFWLDCWSNFSLSEISAVTSMAVLFFINVIIVIGNSLVIAAVITVRSLHTTTNMIITSLAISDLLLGLVILPFSILQTVLPVWVFGEVYCQIWLAVDVWLSTASIYNLVSVSFDRYMAVTKPLEYKLISSGRMGPILVFLAWTVSFFICLPPLVIWSAFAPAQNQTENKQSMCTDCTPMNNDSTYILYSAMGSFFVPLSLILSLNFGIYKKVRASQNPLLVTTAPGGTKKGKNKKKDDDENENDNAAKKLQEPLVLRVHRGRKNDVSQCLQRSFSSQSCSPAPLQNRRTSGQETVPILLDKCLLDITCPVTSFSEDSAPKKSSMQVLRAKTVSNFLLSHNPNQRSKSVHISSPWSHPSTPSFLRKCSSPLWLHGKRSPMPGCSQSSCTGIRNFSLQLPSTAFRNKETWAKLQKLNPALLWTKKRQEQKRYQREEMKAERRVAKTVGIVIGCFLVCWFPFSIIYLLQAYDICSISNGCISETVFKISFFLGYTNSACNPIIYALFSRDFRAAFKRILKVMIFDSKQHSGGLLQVTQKARCTAKKNSVPSFNVSLVD